MSGLPCVGPCRSTLRLVPGGFPVAEEERPGPWSRACRRPRPCPPLLLSASPSSRGSPAWARELKSVRVDAGSGDRARGGGPRGDDRNGRQRGPGRCDARRRLRLPHPLPRHGLRQPDRRRDRRRGRHGRRRGAPHRPGEPLRPALGSSRGGQRRLFAEVEDPVRRKIERYGLTRTVDPRHFFPTLEAAVTSFRCRTGARWTSVPPHPSGDR